MRDYGKLHSSFWTSSTTRDLSDRGRVLAIYLVAGPHTNMIGCFRLPDAYVADDLKWTSARVSEGFAELFQKGFATRDETTKWVFIRRFLRWNPIENPNQGKSAGRLFVQVPNEFVAKPDLARMLEAQGGRVPHSILEPFLNGCETLSEPGTEQEPIQEQEPNGRSVFRPPSIDEVRVYCQERKNSIEPERFIDHYTANGWRVGKASMKDWKACVRTWEKNEFSKSKKSRYTDPAIKIAQQAAEAMQAHQDAANV